MSDTMNTTMKVIENIIVLEVENVLKGWPTYVIKFTPESTRPHVHISTHIATHHLMLALQKIILRLQKPSNCITIGPEDDDSEFVSCPSEYGKSHHAYMCLFLSLGAEVLMQNCDANIMVSEPR